MAAIDFLTQACRWKENPLRMNILTELTSFLKTPVSIAGQEPRQTKSLLGDRIELFLLLSAQDPQKASLILEEVKGTPEDAYYQFASTFYHQKGGN